MARILLVDDEPEVRLVLSRGLRSKGHEVVEAENGRRAITLYRQSEFDMVITDVLMPHMDGVELLRELRNECPLLAISGGGSFGCEILTTMKELGASETLAKPFSFQQLDEIVDKMLTT